MSKKSLPESDTQVKLSKKARASVDKMIAKFQSGDLSALVQIATFDLPDDSPAGKWTFGNRVLAFAQTGSLDCRGYKQWTAAGRQVKKGSVAGYIFSPRMVKKTNKDGEDETRLIGFNQIPVFGSNDTEGETPLTEYTPNQLPPLADIAEKLGISVEYAPLIGRRGDCQTDGSAIRLGTDHEKTWFHELAHALHGKIDGKIDISSKKNYADAEAVAEFTACILMDIYGYGDFSGNAWDYIGGYHSDPLKAIMKACAKVDQILRLVEEG